MARRISLKSPPEFLQGQAGQGERGGDGSFGGGGWDKVEKTASGRKTQTQGNFCLLSGSYLLSPLGQRPQSRERWSVWEGHDGLGGAA